MLKSLIGDLRRKDHQFTVYRSGDPLVIEEWLADRGVEIGSRPLPPNGPEPFIEIKTDGEFVGVVGINALNRLLEPPIVRPGEQDQDSNAYRVIFDVLEETVLSGMNRRELLAVSREIEDRAFRVGTGTLWVSFQTLSIFSSQAEVYRALATDTDLDIHICGIEDWTPPAITGITYHGVEASMFERYWVLAFDGGTDDTQACGLVAEERSDEYTGFWTNDPEIVETISGVFKTAL